MIALICPKSPFFGFIYPVSPDRHGPWDSYPSQRVALAGAVDENRTHDLFLTKEVLYH